jgi:hypothetical protein
MLVRDSDGRLIIISRKDCKNETVYNEKLYNIRLNYTRKFKSVYIYPKIQSSIQPMSQIYFQP